MKEAVTKAIDTLTHGAFQKFWNDTRSALQPEEITSNGTRDFMCVLSIKVPIRKKSGNLFKDPRIYIYIYIIVIYKTL